MKKKLLLGALVVFGFGATFTSCVDDTESASVTAVRQAKAEQLKSVAELNSANAQAALILANAEKAVKEADAAFKLAQAEYQKAYAAYYEAQTESIREKLAIDLQIKQLELEEAKAYLQTRLAQLEAELAQSKLNALKAQQQYDQLLATSKNALVKALLITYENASKTLVQAKTELLNATAQLAVYEADLVSYSESIQNTIEEKQEENANKQIEIDGQNALIAAYEKYAGTEVTQEDIQAAHIKMIETQEAAKEAEANCLAAKEAREEAGKVLSDYYEESVWPWLNSTKNLSYEEWNETTGRIDYYEVRIWWVYDESAPAAAYGKACVIISKKPLDSDGIKQDLKDVTYLPLFEPVTYGETIEINPPFEDGISSYSQYKTYYNLIDGGKAIETVIKHWETRLNQLSDVEGLNNLKEELEELETQLTTAQSEFNAAATAYQTKKTALETAKKNLENNKDESKTAELEEAVETAETELETAEKTRTEKLKTLDEATLKVNEKKEEINKRENSNNWENYEQKLENLKADYADLVAAAKPVGDDIKTYNTNLVALSDARGAELEAQVAASVAQGEYEGIELGIDGGNQEANRVIAEAKDNIANLESEISANEKIIKECKDRLAAIEAGTEPTAEQKKGYIALLKAEIEKATIAVEVAQKKFDMAKEELEAAVKSDATE